MTSFPSQAQTISAGTITSSCPPGAAAASVCVQDGRVVAVETTRTSSATVGSLTAEQEATVAQHPTSAARIPEHPSISKASKAPSIKPGSVREADTGTASRSQGHP